MNTTRLGIFEKLRREKQKFDPAMVMIDFDPTYVSRGVIFTSDKQYSGVLIMMDFEIFIKKL
ncbi:hypothetical protein MXB_327 [Myxobolus squamalis]|nr:hypothetical protein MXB_327 [Myxobolus squamalis]